MSKSNPISNMNCSICDKTTETMLVVCCDRQVCSNCISYCNQLRYTDEDDNDFKKVICNKIICNECVTKCEHKDCNDVACSSCIRIMYDQNSSPCNICELFYCNNHIELCDAECGKMFCLGCKEEHPNDGTIHTFPYDKKHFVCHECFTNFDCCFGCNGNFDNCGTCDKQVCINCDYDNLICEPGSSPVYCIGCEPAEYAEDADDDEDDEDNEHDEHDEDDEDDE